MNKKRKYNKKRKPTKKSKSRYIILFIILILLYLFFHGDQGFLNYLKLKKEKKKLIEQIQALKQQNDSLKVEIEMLTKNYRYIEKIAREQHQMGKKNEKIYIISSPEK